MPSSNHKEKVKKMKSEKENVTIKTEPQEQQPLSFYVDDRIELIRQIFSILKSKTIKSISPVLLQGKSIEKIQEQCLDEILGISKKRLLSIINATKCPSDTETSDSGSEVENIVEHISLDEISSDDDTLVQSTSKKKKLKSG